MSVVSALRCADCMLGLCGCTAREGNWHRAVIAETVIGGTALCARCASRYQRPVAASQREGAV